MTQAPLFGFLFTIAAYFFSRLLYERFRFLLFNPVLVSVSVIIGTLWLMDIPFEDYKAGGDIISFFLGPSVVAIGLVLHEQLMHLRKQVGLILFSVALGAFVGVLVVLVGCQLFGLDAALTATLAPKSVTTPIAIGIAEKMGGLPPLTAAIVIAVGIFGAVIGPLALRLLKVDHPLAFGLAMGSAGGGIATARAIEEGKQQGASSGLAIGLCGAFTSIFVPLLMALFPGG